MTNGSTYTEDSWVAKIKNTFDIGKIFFEEYGKFIFSLISVIIILSIIVLSCHVYANSNQCIFLLDTKMTDMHNKSIFITKKHSVCILNDFFKKIIYWLWDHLSPLIGGYIIGVLSIKK